MKLLFIIFSEINLDKGISKKILAQKKALQHAGINVELCHYKKVNNYRYWAINDRPIAKIGKGVVAYLKHFFYFNPILNYVRNNDIDNIYIRYVHNANPLYLRFLRILKKMVNRIFLEIPTYPYDGEYTNIPWYIKPQVSIERLFRPILHKYIDRIVTFSDDKEIFGIQSINISNAVDATSLPLYKKETTDNNIVFTGVANLMFWHGYDRLIKSLKTYYKTNPSINIYFNIIGTGPEEKKLKELVNHLNLEEYVIFHGSQSGEALNRLFNKSNICIGCLGCHRKNIREVKSLKNVEYATRGIPFIYSENNNDFDFQPYVYKISSDECEIPIQEIIHWYNELNITPQEIRDSVSNLTWDFQMGKIAEMYKSRKNI